MAPSLKEQQRLVRLPSPGLHALVQDLAAVCTVVKVLASKQQRMYRRKGDELVDFGLATVLFCFPLVVRLLILGSGREDQTSHQMKSEPRLGEIRATRQRQFALELFPVHVSKLLYALHIKHALGHRWNNWLPLLHCPSDAQPQV